MIPKLSCVGTYITQAKQFAAAVGGLAVGTVLVSKLNAKGIATPLLLAGSTGIGFFLGRLIFTDMTDSPAPPVDDDEAEEVAGYFKVNPESVTQEMRVRWRRSQDKWDGLPVLPPFEAYARAGRGQGKFA